MRKRLSHLKGWRFLEMMTWHFNGKPALPQGKTEMKKPGKRKRFELRC
jgi:hypothetical protein